MTHTWGLSSFLRTLIHSLAVGSLIIIMTISLFSSFTLHYIKNSDRAVRHPLTPIFSKSV